MYKFLPSIQHLTSDFDMGGHGVMRFFKNASKK